MAPASAWPAASPTAGSATGSAAGSAAGSATGQAAPRPGAGAAPEAAVKGVRADNGAYVTRAVRDGRRLDLTIRSTALGREGHARILLPPGPGSRTARHGLPSLWVLHGCCDSDPGWHAWTDRTDIERATARLRALVVLPEAGPVGFYSDWWNGGAGGAPAWETFHLTELRQILERGLGAGGRRAVAGLSMGGFGALSYAGRHPRMFRAAASFSGVLNTRGDEGHELVTSLLPQWGHDPLALWGDPVSQARIWRAHNPLDLVGRLPRGYPVFVAAGDGAPGPLDPPGTPPDSLERRLRPSSVDYVQRARAHGLRVTADLYAGGTHSWPYWERELHRALPMLKRVLRA
ncbi:esterase family protein [Streptomyces sp. SB3404]|uniref:Esterase family protein n=1 Tax=Streptomyces boncukensis TaxID=2711219 RepID=A0A6G4WST4_9ACTN|nr:esterase family protein [Streptomyces boncukensis]